MDIFQSEAKLFFYNLRKADQQGQDAKNEQPAGGHKFLCLDEPDQKRDAKDTAGRRDQADPQGWVD